MQRLEEIAAQINQQERPPVHLWQSGKLGEIDMEIDSQGNWFHEGGRIRRPALVRLFASILWFEAGEYFLVTPVEKLHIRVVDVPFIILAAEQVEDTWVVTTNTGERVIVGEQHPVELRAYNGQNIPYVLLRHELWARVGRGVYYQWANDALESERSLSPFLFSGNYRIDLG